MTINQGNALDLLKQLSAKWQCPISKDCQRYCLETPATISESGRVLVYQPETGLDVIIFNGIFHEELNIEMTGDFPAPLRLFTQAKGRLYVSSPTLHFHVSPLQCSIHGGFTGRPFSLRIPAGKNVISMITFVHKRFFFKNIACDELAIPPELISVIENMDEREAPFLFQDIFHLPTINALQEIIQQRNVGLLNSIYATAKIYENLYLQLNTYARFAAHSEAPENTSSQKLRHILNAESIISGHLTDPPTIPELARMVGTNQQNLKTGFREVYGTTINQYLTDRRMEQAGVLLRSGKMNIAAVAAAVGYNSPGYFARRFKDRFDVSPREFMRQPSQRKIRSADG